MATSDQIKALVRAHIEGDNERFRSVVLVLAAHAEGKSFALAKSLRELAERRPREQAFTVLPQQMTQLLYPRDLRSIWTTWCSTIPRGSPFNGFYWNNHPAINSPNTVSVQCANSCLWGRQVWARR